MTARNEQPHKGINGDTKVVLARLEERTGDILDRQDRFETIVLKAIEELKGEFKDVRGETVSQEKRLTAVEGKVEGVQRPLGFLKRVGWMAAGVLVTGTGTIVVGWAKSLMGWP